MYCCEVGDVYCCEVGDVYCCEVGVYVLFCYILQGLVCTYFWQG